MNVWQMIGGLVGGLALFLFGLELMTDGLKAIAGARLQWILAKMTANRFLGVLAGGLVTAVLNSSTITTVLMVGFVSAGLMTLAQTIPMIMGANIGSTVTAQLIAFNVSALAPFMLAAGVLCQTFAKRVVIQRFGSVVLGFGLLFLGIQFMSEATHPLRSYAPFIEAMARMEGPLLGIVVGAVFTAIVQSSAATLAIIIALGGQGLLPLDAGIALILGANIGTCGTALLAAIGRPPEALQVGVVHLLFNVVGVLLVVFFIPQFADLVRAISPSAPNLEGVARLAAETPRQVANTHTIFSVANTLVLIWFVGPIARFARWLAPTRAASGTRDGEPRYLDEAALAAAALGLEKARLEVARLGGLTLRNLKTTLAATGPQSLAGVLEDNQQIDRLTSSILHYLGRLSQVEHSEVESRNMVGLTQVTSNLDSIRDVVVGNLILSRQQRGSDGASLMRLRDEHTDQFVAAVITNLERVVAMIELQAAAAPAALEAKERIDTLEASVRRGVLNKLDLTREADLSDFRWAMDLVEALSQIARLSRRIERGMKEQVW